MPPLDHAAAPSPTVMSDPVKHFETHEIHLRRDGKWTIEHAGLSRRQARDLSEEAFRQHGVDGIRIVLSRESMISGNVTEEVLKERFRKLPPSEVIVGIIADAPYCEAIENLFEMPARHCLHRLFSGWLEAHEVGVTECLLSAKLIERLLDRGSLVNTAAQRVASLQTPDGEDSNPRRDELLAFIDRIRELALIDAARANKEAGFAKAPLSERVSRALGDGNFIRAISQITEPLGKQPNRLTKVHHLSEILAGTEDPELRNIVDIVLSDYLMEKTVVLELAGPRAFPKDILEWVVDAAQGTLDLEAAADTSPHDFVVTILKLIRTNHLPHCRDALLFAAEDLLKSEQPLHDSAPGHEKAALLSLTRRLAASQDFAGGPSLAARLTHRFAVYEESGGSSGFVEAADSLALDLNDIHCQTRYLFALAIGAKIGRVKQGLMGTIDRTLRLYGGLQQLPKSRRPGVALARELDGMCLHLEAMELGPKTREAWLGEIKACLAEVMSLRGTADPDLPATLSQLANRGVLRSKTVAALLEERSG